MKPSFFEMSLDSKILAERLALLQPDEVVTYQELSELIGMEVKGSTPILSTARRSVQREYGFVVDCVPKVGLKRLLPGHIIGVGEKEKRRMRRGLKRAVSKIVLAKDEELTREEKVQKQSFVALASTVSHFLKPKQQETLKQAIESEQQLSTGRILDLLKTAK